jgi:hypothetical protein
LLASEVAKQPPFSISTSLWTSSSTMPSSLFLLHQHFIIKQTVNRQRLLPTNPKLHSTPLHGYLLDFVVLGLCVCVYVCVFFFVGFCFLEPYSTPSVKQLPSLACEWNCLSWVIFCIIFMYAYYPFLFLHQYTQPTWSRVADLPWKFLLVPNCFIAFFGFVFRCLITV